MKETTVCAERNEEVWLTAAQCANRIGLTVRALRLYEQRGLIHPRRTRKNWRLYGADEIARLNEILALKRAGLSLTNVAKLLAGHATDLDGLLAMQHSALQEVRDRTERSLNIIDTLRAKIAGGGHLSVDELLKLAKDTNMTEASTDETAWRRYEQARPRTEIKIDPTLYIEYAGYYLLNDLGYVITHRNGRLFTQLTGQSEAEIFPEGIDQFFYKIVPAQITFVRDARGAVSGVVLHQGGYDFAANRVTEELVKGIEDKLAERIKSKMPLANSEALLRKTIAEHQRGEPDYEGMSSPLAALAREQITGIQADLERVGPLRGVSFKGVGPEGWDIYDVHFERGNMEWGFALAADGKLRGLYLRPLP